MGNRDSIFILAKDINMDKDYYNVLNYSEEEMLTLVQRDDKALFKRVDYSFIRESENTICVEIPYETCLRGNYIAFQNKDYSNKWFFAWIVDVTYVSDRATEITYKVDSWSTWFSYWSPKTCYVLREHTNDDTIGANTQPEPVDLGKAYISMQEKDKLFSDLTIGVLVTQWYDDTFNRDHFDNLYRKYNGIYNGLIWLTYPDTVEGRSGIKQLLNEYINAGKEDRIVRVWEYPSSMSTGTPGTSEEISISQSLTIDGYSPKNRKLFTYPYKQIVAQNTNGESETYQFELFSSTPTFDINSVAYPTTECCLVPQNYRGLEKDYSKQVGLNFNIECAWSGSAFYEWYSNNISSIYLGSVSNAISGVTSLASQNGAGGVSSLTNELNQNFTIIGDFIKARNASSKVHGNFSSGGLTLFQGNLGFRIREESIKAEFAKNIDNYFTRYGYQTNRLKVPNITGRKIFNYIEIGNTDDIGTGGVPIKYMQEINTACRRGVTIWHDHANIGNFNLDNSIV